MRCFACGLRQSFRQNVTLTHHTAVHQLPLCYQGVCGGVNVSVGAVICAGTPFPPSLTPFHPACASVQMNRHQGEPQKAFSEIAVFARVQCMMKSHCSHTFQIISDACHHDGVLRLASGFQVERTSQPRAKLQHTTGAFDKSKCFATQTVPDGRKETYFFRVRCHGN
jgi:gamma-glutamyl-gamma-aminobutyrate hydrolase PuuD